MRTALDKLFTRLGVGSSIASRLRFSLIMLIVLLMIPGVVSVTMMAQYAMRYHALIQQVNRVAALKPIVRTAITDELWEAVAGNISFEEGRHYQLVNQVNTQIEALMETSQENHTELTVARRTMGTLVDYIDLMGEQFAQMTPVAEREATLEEVRNVASLVTDTLEKYVDMEIGAASRTSDQLQRMLEGVLMVLIILLVLTFAFAVFAQRSLSQAIQEPISELEKFAGALAGGDFQVRAPDTQVNELQSLTYSFNTMGAKLQLLIDENRREQENLKKSELRALQAQIAPHFLYNTLDAIVWLAEAKRNEEVIRVTGALSDFFRISLSQGKDWIPLSEEIKHLVGYLTIQKIRYRDILDYRIDIPEDLHNQEILKLLLQPLVENAIYHGIKSRRGRGLVVVRGRVEQGQLVLSVTDNGVGMSEDRLRDVREQLSGSEVLAENSGYGLYNVNQRIKLYYNQSQGIEILSDENGTTTRLRVPLRGVKHV